MTDVDILKKCSRIFLIDGQDISPQSLADDFPELQASDAPFSNSLAKDSIHFQQLRAYMVSKRLLDHYSEIIGDSSSLRVGIIGAGFSGLTAALTLLNKKSPQQNISVTVFEHHRNPLPRLEGAYGRRIYPYHHIRKPRQPVKSSLQWEIKSGVEEMGGIPGVLSWNPGSVDDVAEQVRRQIPEDIVGEFEVNYYNKINDVEEITLPDGKYKYVLSSSDFQIPDSAPIITSESLEMDVDDFDIVIIAAGGQKDIVSVTGQHNRNYWLPNRTEMLAPKAEADEIAIIGSGDSAASEVIHYSVASDCFVDLLRNIQYEIKDYPALLDLLDEEMHGLSLKDFKDKFIECGFESYISTNTTFLDGLLRNKNKQKVTLFVRRSDNEIFDKMNHLNKFLVLFLNCIGHIEIRDLHRELGLEANANPEMKLDVRADLYKLEYGDKIIYPNTKYEGELPEHCWSAVYNCRGTSRLYHKVFSGERSETTDGAGKRYRVWLSDKLLEEAASLEELIGCKKGLVGYELSGLE